MLISLSLNAVCIGIKIYLYCLPFFFFKGPPGTTVQITGCNFGIDILEVLEMINKTQCNVTMVNDSVLQCIVGEHAGGTFPVTMHHKTKGSAVSTVVFEYPLTIQNIHPGQGRHKYTGTYKYIVSVNTLLRKHKTEQYSSNTAKICILLTLKIFLLMHQISMHGHQLIILTYQFNACIS